jgi:protein phosphatase
VRSFGFTDRGRVRSANEDQFLIAVLARALRVKRTSLPKAKMRYGDERGYLFVVADGVSGQQGGEEASALAVDLVEQFTLNTLRWCFQLKGTAEQKLLTELKEAFERADAAICREATRHPELWGMATTMTLAYNYHSDLFLAHVGDSRGYLFRGGNLHQLTRDHTVAQELVHRGRLASGRAKSHWLRHMITNVLGGPELGVKPEVHKVRLEPGDMMLLCSDGLTDKISDDLIALVLAGEPDPEKACRRLVARANEQGGEDNVTVVVARFEATAQAPR